MISTLTNLIGNIQIEDLPIPYTAVAADIDAEKEVWIKTGPLFDAIRASVSLPLFFTPFDYQGRKLIDGGVLNPVPIAPTFNDNTELTIAVNLGGPMLQETTKETEDIVFDDNSTISHYFFAVKNSAYPLAVFNIKYHYSLISQLQRLINCSFLFKRSKLPFSDISSSSFNREID